MCREGPRNRASLKFRALMWKVSPEGQDILEIRGCTNPRALFSVKK